MEVTNGQAHQAAPANHGRRQRGMGKRKLGIAIAAGSLVVIIAILVGLVLYKSSTNSAIDGGKYQAVFLSNGQVYFGKLQSLDNGYLRLGDVYYIQTTKTADGKTQDIADSTGDIQLIKLGEEVHGPKDEMMISKDQVLFFENLKDEGKVASSIKQYKDSQKK